MDFEDDLSKDIAAAIDANTASTEPPADKTGVAPPAEADSGTPPPEKASAGERARDEQGRFKETAKASAEDKQQPSAPETGSPAQQKPLQPDTVAPPVHWKGNGKIEWNRLPKQIQQAINEDYATITKTQGELQEFRSAIGDDRAQVLAANYGSVGQGLKNLFALSDFATKNPAGFVQWFAQQRGIDLTQGGQGAQQGQSAAAPNPLEREVQSLKQEIQSLRQGFSSGQETQLQSEVDRFRSDPSHPYFEDVRQDMAALVKAGVVKNLTEAYEKATWARPDIREHLLAQERQKTADANKAAVESARQARTSVTGSPQGAKPPPDAPDLSLEDLIRKQVDRVYA